VTIQGTRLVQISGRGEWGIPIEPDDLIRLYDPSRAGFLLLVRDRRRGAVPNVIEKIQSHTENQSAPAVNIS